MSRASNRRRCSGETLRFPVNTTTRDFRRSCSEPRFPADSLERNAVKLKAAPIRFCWRTATGEGGDPSEKEKNTSAEIGVSRGVVDPHRTGFGRNLVTPIRVRSPPPTKVVEGILGRDPWTRGMNPEEIGDEVSVPAGIEISNRDPDPPSGGGRTYFVFLSFPPCFHLSSEFPQVH
ncbi:hypothetical protein PVAP13_5KG381107 [Panicum virgatum]|uniref:Uncharacterized protein n=1 Tax=Panicum virgatum TaxID=38727 RepID=A0A8T0SIK5_PANVG|nr:hypothetical protein PVAP13_5KG381107 [Panicum virgatum]